MTNSGLPHYMGRPCGETSGMVTTDWDDVGCYSCKATREVAAVPNRVTDQATRTDADALRDTANHHQGTRVHAADADHGRQLRRQGLVGPRGGLTRRGSIAAERLRNAALDDAFGPL